MIAQLLMPSSPVPGQRLCRRGRRTRGAAATVASTVASTASATPTAPATPTALHQVLGTPDRRALFDQQRRADGGGDSYAEFEARWRTNEFGFDSDLYKGAKFVTTLTERLWERRLTGDTVWLVEAYAAWCPACRAFLSTWQATGGAPMR
jgi:hypothetical protein